MELRRVPLFATLPESQLDELVARSRVRGLVDGEVVAREGDTAGSLVVVEHGALAAVQHSVNGRRVALGVFRAPCSVDKVALLDGGRHTATWEARGSTSVRLVPRDCLLLLIRDVESVRLHVLSYLAAEARRLRNDRLLASTADASTRLAAWLADGMPEHGRLIPLPHGQQGLGEAVGASRVTVNRCLQALVRKGAIRIETGGAIRILKPDLLPRPTAP